MKKQSIKLKESQLRQIIRESIMNVLSEEQLNELDPRTYASYAQKRAEQANGERALSTSQQRRGLNQQQIQQQAAQGKKAAVNAFNKQYGYDKQYPINGEYKQGLNQARYELDTGTGDDNYPYRAHTYYAETDPKYAHGQTINFGKNGQNDVKHRDGSWGYNYGEYSDNNIYHPYDSVGREQTRIAQQMANGTGRYDKQTGKWS